MYYNRELIKEIGAIGIKFAVCMGSTPKSFVGREFIQDNNKLTLAAVCLGNILAMEAIKKATAYYEKNPNILDWLSSTPTPDTSVNIETTQPNTEITQPNTDFTGSQHQITDTQITDTVLHYDFPDNFTQITHSL